MSQTMPWNATAKVGVFEKPPSPTVDDQEFFPGSSLYRRISDTRRRSSSMPASRTSSRRSSKSKSNSSSSLINQIPTTRSSSRSSTTTQKSKKNGNKRNKSRESRRSHSTNSRPAAPPSPLTSAKSLSSLQSFQKRNSISGDSSWLRSTPPPKPAKVSKTQNPTVPHSVTLSGPLQTSKSAIMDQFDSSGFKTNTTTKPQHESAFRKSHLVTQKSFTNYPPSSPLVSSTSDTALPSSTLSTPKSIRERPSHVRRASEPGQRRSKFETTNMTKKALETRERGNSLWTTGGGKVSSTLTRKRSDSDAERIRKWEERNEAYLRRLETLRSAARPRSTSLPPSRSSRVVDVTEHIPPVMSYDKYDETMRDLSQSMTPKSSFSSRQNSVGRRSSHHRRALDGYTSPMISAMGTSTPDSEMMSRVYSKLRSSSRVSRSRSNSFSLGETSRLIATNPILGVSEWDVKTAQFSQQRKQDCREHCKRQNEVTNLGLSARDPAVFDKYIFKPNQATIKLIEPTPGQKTLGETRAEHSKQELQEGYNAFLTTLRAKEAAKQAFIETAALTKSRADPKIKNVANGESHGEEWQLASKLQATSDFKQWADTHPVQAKKIGDPSERECWINELGHVGDAIHFAAIQDAKIQTTTTMKLQAQRKHPAIEKLDAAKAETPEPALFEATEAQAEKILALQKEVAQQEYAAYAEANKKTKRISDPSVAGPNFTETIELANAQLSSDIRSRAEEAKRDAAAKIVAKPRPVQAYQQRIKAAPKEDPIGARSEAETLKKAATFKAALLSEYQKYLEENPNLRIIPEPIQEETIISEQLAAKEDRYKDLKKAIKADRKRTMKKTAKVKSLAATESQKSAARRQLEKESKLLESSFAGDEARKLAGDREKATARKAFAEYTASLEPKKLGSTPREDPGWFEQFGALSQEQARTVKRLMEADYQKHKHLIDNKPGERAKYLERKAAKEEETKTWGKEGQEFTQGYEGLKNEIIRGYRQYVAEESQKKEASKRYMTPEEFERSTRANFPPTLEQLCKEEEVRRRNLVLEKRKLTEKSKIDIEQKKQRRAKERREKSSNFLAGLEKEAQAEESRRVSVRKNTRSDLQAAVLEKEAQLKKLRASRNYGVGQRCVPPTLSV